MDNPDPHTSNCNGDIRVMALDFATRQSFASDNTGERVIERARRYLAFIKGQEGLSDQKPLRPEDYSA
jgi:hypothetical protein